MFCLRDWACPETTNLLFPELAADVSTAGPTAVANAVYEVTLTTGNYRGAGLDGNLFITLVGDKVCGLTCNICIPC